MNLHLSKQTNNDDHLEEWKGSARVQVKELALSEYVRVRSVTRSCLTLCNPMDCSLPGSSVHGIFQARILEWVVISSSKGSNSCLLHCRQILYRLSHQGSSWIKNTLAETIVEEFQV